MFKRILEDYKKKHTFSAERCRDHQKSDLTKRAVGIIEDIKAYINFKVDNTEEKAVLYSVHNSEDKAFQIVEDYFRERGFRVFRTKFQELGDDIEFLVISWIL